MSVGRKFFEFSGLKMQWFYAFLLCPETGPGGLIDPLGGGAEDVKHMRS